MKPRRHPPEAPANLRIENLTYRSAHLRWHGECGDDGGDVNRTCMIYEVQLNKAGRFDVTSANQTIFLGSVNSYQYEDDDGHGKLYAYRVRARYPNSSWTDWHGPLESKMPEPLPASPDAHTQ